MGAEQFCVYIVLNHFFFAQHTARILFFFFLLFLEVGLVLNLGTRVTRLRGKKYSREESMLKEPGRLLFLFSTLSLKLIIDCRNCLTVRMPLSRVHLSKSLRRPRICQGDHIITLTIAAGAFTSVCQYYFYPSIIEPHRHQSLSSSATAAKLQC